MVKNIQQSLAIMDSSLKWLNLEGEFYKAASDV